MEFKLKKDDVAGRHGAVRCDNIIGSSRKKIQIISKNFHGGIVLMLELKKN